MGESSSSYTPPNSEHHARQELERAAAVHTWWNLADWPALLGLA